MLYVDDNHFFYNNFCILKLYYIGEHCKIHEVKINPCPEASNNEPCRIKRGRTASMEFEFTPGNINIYFAHFLYKLIYK